MEDQRGAPAARGPGSGHQPATWGWRGTGVSGLTTTSW